MSQQRTQSEPLEDRNTGEQEPVFVTDQNGIVIVWPDRRVQRFSWSALRQLSAHNGFFTPNGEQRI